MRIPARSRKAIDRGEQALRGPDADVAFDEGFLELLAKVSIGEPAAENASEATRECAPAPGEAPADPLDRTLGGSPGGNLALGCSPAPGERADGGRDEQDDDQRRPCAAPQEKGSSSSTPADHSPQALAARLRRPSSRSDSRTETSWDTPGSGMVTP
jgi:hypothetical protein